CGLARRRAPGGIAAIFVLGARQPFVRASRPRHRSVSPPPRRSAARRLLLQRRNRRRARTHVSTRLHELVRTFSQQSAGVARRSLAALSNGRGAEHARPPRFYLVGILLVGDE